VEKVEKRSSDFLLILLIVILAGIGVSMLYSASYYSSQRLGKEINYFFIKQLVWLLVGGIGAFFMATTPLELIKKIIPAILAISFILIILTYIPGIGRTILGARRWIFVFNTSFQPSEFAKLALVLYLAYILSKKDNDIDDLMNSILPPLLIVTFFVVLIFFQNDFSTAVFIFLVCLFIFYIAKVRLIYFLFLGTVIVPFSLLMIFINENRVKRLISFLLPEKDHLGSGFQVIQSNLALFNGGVIGKGIGMGEVKEVLPEANSDYIFAVIGEETGYIGVVFIILLFICFAYRGYMIAFKCEDRFQYFLAFGITTMITVQALVNISVVAGLLPPTGIPLPFFSSGGSSLFVSMLMAGLLINISREVKHGKGYLDV
jgi:cell division protein FtsW